jgi:hypothetical protein
MGLKPKPSFSTSFLDNLELHPKLKQLLSCTLYGRKPPRVLFNDISYRYYMVYVKPKITMALKNKFVKLRDRYGSAYKKLNLVIYVSPSYMLYMFTSDIKECGEDNGDCSIRDGSRHYYILGVDNDGKIFVNRVSRAPTLYDNKIEMSPNIELRLVRSDSEFYYVMGYRIDLGDKEEITIDVAGRTGVRVQGDIVLIVEPLGGSLTGYIHREQIINHLRLLLVDVINRILLDHGISCIIARDGVLIENIAPRRNETPYLRKIFNLIAKELKELLGDVEIHHDWLLINSGDFRGFIVSARTRSGGFGNRYNHIAIEITWSNSEMEHNQFLVALQNEMLKAIENIPFTNTEFNMGNHHVKAFNVKPLSFTYRPNKQPLTIGENIITIINQLTFIVNPKSWVELYHKEHGVKTIRFNNDYVIRFVHVLIDSRYIDERNRVIVRNLEI